MRRSRRGAHFGAEFGGSGEDSFVAVVVTKLTGALLFILLMSLVIMALIPKAADLARPAQDAGESGAIPLAIRTPEALPEAIAGRPYTLALAATGGSGPLQWSVEGKLPEGLRFDPETAQIQGTPKAGTPKPVPLTLRVSDGRDRTASTARLVVFESDAPLTIPSAWLPKLPPIPWRSWLEQGFGFLVLLLVYLLGRSVVASIERWSFSTLPADAAENVRRAWQRRFTAYRAIVGLAAIASAAALGVWLWRPIG